jgi:superfamily II RNA helicase
MDHPLHRAYEAAQGAALDTILSGFLDFVASRRLELYPAQEEAILELYAGHNVILNTPTGSGKSLVATALHFKSLCQNRRSVYTCPIKALVNEKFLALCRDFGPDQVGMSTGDATVNREAPILCCTAEILANIALREGAQARVHDVIMDEFHYYADRERGVAWQVPLLTLPQARFLLMSATLGETAFFETELKALTGTETVTVKSAHRPVPLVFEYAEAPVTQTLERLISEQKIPVYLVHFTQLECAQSAQDFLSVNFCTREEKHAIAAAIEGFKFSSPYGPDIRKWLKHGIGLHHAGLLPKYRVLVEQLAQKGLLKIICGTDTLGVGINVPIRTVLFTKLCKFDGEKTGILTARDFHQISGRAGRKGFDDRGWVVVQAPEHVIENKRLELKSTSDGKPRKFVKRKPPEKNFVAWDKNTFQRLISSSPERLVSRFQVSHGMLLNVLSQPGDGCRAMCQLVRRCHDSPHAKRAHTQRAWQLFRSLLDRKIIEFTPPSPAGAKLRVNVELQDDFSLDQTLSLYLIDTLKLLDPLAPAYALDLLTLVEAILEDPDIILQRQLHRLRAQRVAELKLQGVDYEDRMLELEQLEYPKPNREFIYSTFNAFADQHPWIGQENIRPKSIAREMYESCLTFADYIREYELQRAEGLLLRHLSSVYKVLSQTVPDTHKTEAVCEMETAFGILIRQVDSSLLDEWERMRDPHWLVQDEPRAAARLGTPAPADVTQDRLKFTALIRTELFRFIRALATRQYAVALTLVPHPPDAENQPWTEDRLRQILDAYCLEHQRICFDPEARNARHTFVQPAPPPTATTWKVDQILVDPQGHNDWMISVEVDLKASREAEEPVLKLLRIGPVSASERL